MSEQRHSVLAIHPAIDVDETDPSELLKRRHMLRRAQVLAAIVLLLLLAGAGRTMLARDANAKVLQANVATQGLVHVKTTLPRADAASATVTLPGTLQGQVQAVVSARASGYLRRWTKDIGSRVAQGELLAEIDTPEIDQQLSQALAAREQTAASLALARSTVERWEGLRAKDVVSQQELDERRSQAAQAQANLAAADANVMRLRQTEGFKRVLAPIAGVVTRRNVEVGDLIDGGGGAGRALFVLAQTDPLRVTVNVPQAWANQVKPGQAVVVTQAELRGQRFAGKVARTSASIDTGTRTMQVEVQLPNRDGTLLPGTFVQVQLPLAGSGVLQVPPAVLIFRAEGIRVAVVDAKGGVRLRPVVLGRNFGHAVELLDGITPADRLVMNPSDSLADGDSVVTSDGADAGSAARGPRAAASGAAAASASGPASNPTSAGKARP